MQPLPVDTGFSKLYGDYRLLYVQALSGGHEMLRVCCSGAALPSSLLLSSRITNMRLEASLLHSANPSCFNAATNFWSPWTSVAPPWWCVADSRKVREAAVRHGDEGTQQVRRE